MDATRFAVRVRGNVVLGLVALAWPCAAAAQDCPPCPPPPPPGWDISIGGGLSLTSGNSRARSYNLTAHAVHDPKTRNLFRVEALYLRTDQDGEASADRTLAQVRDEYTVSGRLFTFGQLGYQRDVLKQVEYLIAPTAGLGYRLVERAPVLLVVDASAGGAFEKLTGRDGTQGVALLSGERLEWKVTPAVSFVQRANALWKADDFGDAYYRLELGLTATLAKWLELKLTFADDYKTRPPLAGLKKNDTTVIVSFLLTP